MKTTVLLLRHEASRSGEEKPITANLLNPQSQDRAFRSGVKLSEMGHTVHVALSSPQFRAIQTIQNLLAGNSGGKGPVTLTGVDSAYGDLLLGEYSFSEAEKQDLIAAAKAANVGPEELLLTSPKFAEKLAARGEEGARALLEAVRYFMGKTIAICSHGGSRIEAVVAHLLCVGISGIQAAAPGSVYLIEFNETLSVERVEYLGVLADGSK